MASHPNPFGGALGKDGTDAAFIIICAFIVFTMQSGFGLLESGMVSRRSQASAMVKSMMDVVLGGVTWWVVGYGLSFGKNDNPSKSFVGNSYFLLNVDIVEDEKDANLYPHYFFQMAFATKATTIVSGAVAERLKLKCYMLFIIIDTALIYVFPCHWIWGEGGWLYGKAKDFAGSAVVHMSGGAAALAATLILKPRRYRYNKKSDDQEYSKLAKRPSSLDIDEEKDTLIEDICWGRADDRKNHTNVLLGTFFLWWGWIGFNCGSHLAVSGGNWRYVGSVAVVTFNGALGGGSACVILGLILNQVNIQKYTLDIDMFTAAILGGLVAITGGADVIRPWEGLLIGAIGGLVALGAIALLDKYQIDDPVGCIGVHWAAGFFGMIATGLFAGTEIASESGLFHKGTGELLWWNLAACASVTVWSFGMSAIVLFLLNITIGIRLSEEEEIEGSDEFEHGIVKTE